MTRIGLIGGSGLEKPDIIKLSEQKIIDTEYGNPSSPLICGTIGGKEVVVLSRHGFDHSIPPTQVNNRANISALKQLGCTHILATTACGSLRENIKRGDIVIPDQFIDFTRQRRNTFFETFSDGDLRHTAMADPFDEELRNILINTAAELELNVHPRGTVITIEGPRFSTRAESKMFRIWGADIINMSVAPEVILANEIGIQYAAVAMSTDYDSWKEDEEPVSWEEVLKVFNENVHSVVKLLLEAIGRIG